jgi:hypothetical protein
MLPHTPYEYLPSGHNHLGPDLRYTGIGTEAQAGTGAVRSEDALQVAQEQQLYLLQLGALDRLIGRLIQRLKQTGMYDDCLLVVAGDHGVSFRTGDESRRFTPGNAADIMSIPLFIKAPLQRQGVVSDRNVEIVDVLPTLAELLGVRLPWSTDGASAADPTAPERPVKVLETAQSGRQSFEGHFPERAESLRLMLQRFGDGQDPLALYRIGPHGEIVGRALADLNIGPASTCEVQCDLAHGLRQWRTDDRYAPCSFEGSVKAPGGMKLPVRLAISVRGVVQAVTRTFNIPDRRQLWCAAIPEEALRPGDNQVEFFVMEDEGQELVLRPARLMPQRSEG